MMIGEFEFDSIFYGMGGVDPSDPADVVHKAKLYYSAVSYALFVVFLVLMAILVTNLLVGLAVDDIKAVQEQAILKRLAMQVDMLGRSCITFYISFPSNTRAKFPDMCSKENKINGIK